MGIVFLIALVLGMGTIAVQLLMSGDSDADADVGHDLDADFDADVDADTVHVGEADPADSMAADGGAGVFALFLSIRFWTFGLMAFGLCGSLLHYLHLASSPVTLALALVMGVGSGLLASWSFRALSRATMSSGASARDVVGQVGRVMVPVAKNGRGKIRVEVLGQIVDYMATTDDERIEAGTHVLVEQVDGESVHVSPAPVDLLPPKQLKP